MAAFVPKIHIIYSLAVNPLPSNPVYRFTKKVPSIFTLILCSRHVLHLLSLQAVSYSTHVSLSSSVSVLSSPQARFDPHHSQTPSPRPCLLVPVSVPASFLNQSHNGDERKSCDIIFDQRI